MTNSTVQIALQNNTGSANAYAYITGLDINNNSTPLLIQSDGVTVYHPVSPSGTLQPLAADCAISLGAVGSTRTITIPQIAGGRIWFVLDGKLTFLINPGPAIVEPSVTNPSDPNYNNFWGFCEFTFNQAQLFVNISYVDFVSLPIALSLRNESGGVQSVTGLNPGGLNAVCSALIAQDNIDHAGWSKLIVKAPNGTNLRALSPNSGIVMNNSLFSGYYQSYVNSVWQQYTNQALTINTQAEWGNVTGKVVNGKLTFAGVGSFAQPSAADVFSCSTGPFGSYPSNVAAEMGAIGARLAAAFNRSTLLLDAQQPEGEQVANYYKSSPTNHYSRICHANNGDLRGYAFPYDDVGPSSGGDQSGSVFDGAPSLLTVTIGGVSTSQAAAVDAAAAPEDQKVVRGHDKPAAPAKNTAPQRKRSTLAGLKNWRSVLRKRLAKAK
jgi:hypothetical protein